MTRNSSLSEPDARSISSRASNLSVLNDEECKRILAVLDRDFQLRQIEYKRIEDLKRQIRQESERAEYLSNSKEFNLERCITCFKQFRFILNPKELCSECKLFVCHDCCIYTPETKTWTCKSCIKLKEYQILSSSWFYDEVSKKHKRCGSAKIVRELHKRERELGEFN
ncbi:unnamed protein product [Rotaria socialis]|uniref:RabBD domain-containing protein n=1 Tax=Rotaria socialis TaxID=392032 RepID=A0A820Y4S3_9BILA|nr:unnamed protein product [Rotaria socialis]CAF4542768.1 unnamed protein product [Rotaria socialis]